MAWRRLLRWWLLAVLVAGVLPWPAQAARDIRPERQPTHHPPLASETTAPGHLVDQTPLTDRVLPEGTQAWRITYTTTLPDDSPAVGIATVLAPATRPATPLPVLAWDHGAVGLAPQCLPSTWPDPLRGMPALAQVAAEPWVVVAPDYAPGPGDSSPFLIGAGEGRSTLDAIRAVRQLPGLQVANHAVIWGHSQGAHAALWSAIIAPAYAPDVRVEGVAAIAPVTGLVSLLDRQTGNGAAPILASWLAAAYAAFYPDIAWGDIVTPAAQAIARELAARCPGEPLDGLAIALLIGELGGDLVLQTPPPPALRERLQENEPDGAITVPILVAQGLADDVILPPTTARFVTDRCAGGARLAYWRLAGEDHLSPVEADSPLAAPLLAWTRARFAGEPVASGCTTHTYPELPSP